MKNKVIIGIIVVLFALTGALIWYAFRQSAEENASENNVFDENNTVDGAEGFQFDNLPEPAPSPSELEEEAASQPADQEVNISEPPVPAPIPSFDANQFQGVEGSIEAPGGDLPTPGEGIDALPSPTSSLIPLSEVAKKKLLLNVG
jgi:cytoskeletal protein RodZ